MNDKGDTSYTFELKDLNYNDLCDVYKSMVDFVAFLKKSKDGAEVVKDENEEKEDKGES